MFPTNADEDSELITIIGKKQAVEQAKTLLEASIKDIVSTFVLNLYVTAHPILTISI